MTISPLSAERALTIVNWNIYLGADIVRLVDGVYPGPIEERAAALWAMVRNTDFPRRAGFIAARIAEISPELVALQEVFRWTVAPAGGTAGAVTIDYLELLEQELGRRGASYRAVRTFGFTCAVPMPGGEVLTMQDSIVTLVRADLGGVRSAGASYEAARSVPIGGRAVRAARCWSAVDVATPWAPWPLRLVNTHLEFDRPAQREQARELLALLEGHPGPTLLAGDFNLDAPREPTLNEASDEASDDPALYQALRARGFHDAWRERGHGAGFTATQPEELLNHDSKLDTRIDWILARDTGRFAHAWLLGASARDRALLGLWPSDHAGLTATLAPRQG